MTLPPPPTGFSAQQNVGALIALQAIATDTVPDVFGRNGGNPVQAVLLDITVLDGPNAGQHYPGSTNTSALGRQFIGCVGDGKTYFGRITGQAVGQGTALVLTEPRPGDGPLIESYKQYAARQQQQAGQWGGPAMNGGQGQPQPQQQAPQNWQQQQPQQSQPWGGQPQPQQPQQGPWNQPPPPQQPAPQSPWPTPPQQGYPQQPQQQQQPASVPPSFPPSSPYDDPPPF
jgi:hypothetical protein